MSTVTDFPHHGTYWHHLLGETEPPIEDVVAAWHAIPNDNPRKPRIADIMWNRLTPSWNARADAVGVITGRWPYGPNAWLDFRYRMVEWAEAHRMRLISSDSRACPHWVAGRIKHDSGDDAMGWGRYGYGTCSLWQTGIWDHATKWRNLTTGTRALLVQPYATAEMTEPVVAPVAEELGLRFELVDGWYCEHPAALLTGTVKR